MSNAFDDVFGGGNNVNGGVGGRVGCGSLVKEWGRESQGSALTGLLRSNLIAGDVVGAEFASVL